MIHQFLWIAGAVIGLTIIFHFLTIFLLPYFIVAITAIKTKREPNLIYHVPPTTAESRDVVRPSPDLLYSGISYDISNKPLRITTPVPPDTYFSFSAFALNTDNFFVINDRRIKSDRVEIILTREKLGYQKKNGEIVVNAPSKRGAIFMRTLVKDPDDLKRLFSLREQASCELVD